MSKVRVFLIKCLKFPFMLIAGAYEGYVLLILDILPLRKEALNLIIFTCRQRLEGSYFLGVSLESPNESPVKPERHRCDCGKRILDDEVKNLHVSGSVH